MRWIYLIKTNKLLFYIFLGWNLAPFVHFLNTYVYNDWEFLKFLFVICCVDTALGIAKAIKQKNLSTKGFGMVFYKMIVYSSALITSHVLVSFTVHNNSSFLFTWFDNVIFAAIIVKEGVSIFENIAIIDPSVFPKSILKYLRDFDAAGKLRPIDEQEKPKSK
jgi:phage-related holin